MRYEKWEYKDHVCVIDVEVMEGNSKAWYYVTLPGGKVELHAELDCYGASKQLVEMWIDAGYPKLHRVVKHPNGSVLTERMVRMDDLCRILGRKVPREWGEDWADWYGKDGVE